MTINKLQVKIILTLIFITILITPNLFSQSNSVIGLTVDFSAPAGPIENADLIYFIKIEEDSKILEIKSIIRSNYKMDNQIYLKDIEPGRYAIVAIGKGKVLPIYNLTELTTFFSEALIKENIVTVDSNDVVFMGRYTVTTKMMVSNKKSDDAQLHFYKIITKKNRVPSYMRQVSLNTWFYRADLENIEIKMTDQNDFYIKALKHFQGTELEKIIRTKLDREWPYQSKKQHINNISTTFSAIFKQCFKMHKNMLPLI